MSRLDKKKKTWKYNTILLVFINNLGIIIFENLFFIEFFYSFFSHFLQEKDKILSQFLLCLSPCVEREILFNEKYLWKSWRSGYENGKKEKFIREENLGIYIYRVSLIYQPLNGKKVFCGSGNLKFSYEILLSRFIFR